MTVIEIPGSKSVTARALFLAAAARGETVLRRPLRSDDSEGFVEGLSRLGYEVAREDGDRSWRITGRPEGPGAADADIYCRDGATTARFLPALVAAAPAGSYRFDASAQMRRRPLGPLTRALRELGVDLTHGEGEGHHPLRIDAHGIKGGHLVLDAGESSQYLTALLMLGPLTEEGLTIDVTRLVSAPYVEITLAMMRRFGVEVAREGSRFSVPPGGYRATDYVIEPDASTASYFFAAAALTPGREVTVPGLGRHALQGDTAFVDVLERMGAEVVRTDDAITVRGPERLRGLTVNMRDISDTMPTLAALAPYADGPVRIEDVANTRVKECDRLDACAQNLRALGVGVRTGPDWIEIRPGTPRATGIETHGDHRIVMSFAVTALRAPGMTYDDPGCVRKTFPGFHEAFGALRDTWAAVPPAGTDVFGGTRTHA
ncbi:3-phosphoshikimate 1-carboxyvinyltransferase [Streptomyces sp. NBC_01497]|uniref:3-phosphoshikimate 1-carboxyvinyltransferase n=1 Tax=Streptomyces sp. NBC_01497 TaxID=2903885 RepID=UPI002E3369F4|nr:3-phosphoshikimate 1-carboxyvinyltransferase [Streptomyces sp. NBC_01497]